MDAAGALAPGAGQLDAAQAAYDAARKAYPDAKVRTELDVLGGRQRAGGADDPQAEAAGVIAGLGVVLAVALGLILFALRDQIVFFYSPSEIHEKAVAAGTPIRLGGLVKEGSWKKVGDRQRFRRHRRQTEMAAHYIGILPDLFREGQGVVAEGSDEQRRQLHRHQRAGQARRELHAQGSRRGAQGAAANGSATEAGG